MNRRKKVVLICSAAAAFVAAASFGITLAYLGDTTGKDNTVIVGHGDEEISEEFSAPSEVSMRNNEVEKKFSITNTGTVPLFARLYAEFSDSTIADKAKVKVDNKEYEWAEFKKQMEKSPDQRGDDRDILPVNWRYMRENPETPRRLLRGRRVCIRLSPDCAPDTRNRRRECARTGRLRCSGRRTTALPHHGTCCGCRALAACRRRSCSCGLGCLPSGRAAKRRLPVPLRPPFPPAISYPPPSSRRCLRRSCRRAS